MALTGDFQRKSAWSVNANGHRITELTPGTSSRAPAFYGIRTDYRDGDGNGGVGSGSASERAELQRGEVGSYGVMKWYRWVEKFAANWPIGAPNTGEDWCYCIQWHLAAGGTYAPIAMNVYGDRRSIRTNPNNGSWIQRGNWSLDRGSEVEWRLGILWSTGSNGRIIAFRNGAQVLNVTGKTCNTQENPYIKLGVYRSGDKSGQMLWDCWGLQEFDQDPGSFIGGGGGGGTVDPPPVTVPDFTVTAGERALGWPRGVATFQSGSGNAKRGSVIPVDVACQLVGYAIATRGGNAAFNARLCLYDAVDVGTGDPGVEPLVTGSVAPVIATPAGAADQWRRVNLTTPIMLPAGKVRATAQFDVAGTYAITAGQGGMAYADDPYANGPAATFAGESTTFNGVDGTNGLQVVLIVRDAPPGALTGIAESDTTAAATLVPTQAPGTPGPISRVVYLLGEQVIQRVSVPHELLDDGTVGAELVAVGDGTFRVVNQTPTS